MLPRGPRTGFFFADNDSQVPLGNYYGAGRMVERRPDELHSGMPLIQVMLATMRQDSFFVEDEELTVSSPEKRQSKASKSLVSSATASEILFARDVLQCSDSEASSHNPVSQHDDVSEIHQDGSDVILTTDDDPLHLHTEDVVSTQQKVGGGERQLHANLSNFEFDKFSAPAGPEAFASAEGRFTKESAVTGMSSQAEESIPKGTAIISDAYLLPSTSVDINSNNFQEGIAVKRTSTNTSTKRKTRSLEQMMAELSQLGASSLPMPLSAQGSDPGPEEVHSGEALLVGHPLDSGTAPAVADSLSSPGLCVASSSPADITMGRQNLSESASPGVKSTHTSLLTETDVADLPRTTPLRKRDRFSNLFRRIIKKRQKMNKNSVSCETCNQEMAMFSNGTYLVQYGGMVICGHCDKVDLAKSEEQFWHCGRCNFDLCTSCALGEKEGGHESIKILLSMFLFFLRK